MRVRDSRTELAAVAVALLLPIPLFVAGGLRLPLPAAIERGLASLGSGGALGSTSSEAPPDDSEPDAGADVTGSAGASAPAGDRQATSSSALIVHTEAAPAGGKEGVQTPGGGSTPDTGGDDPEGAPGPDAPAAPPRDRPQDTPPAPVQATAETAVDADAPLEVNLTEESVEVVVAGESVEVPVPDPPTPEVPVPPPSVPLPPLPVP